MEIYVTTKDQLQKGPFNEEQLTQMLDTGAISYDDLGWVEGMKEWLPLRNLVVYSGNEQTPAQPPAPMPTPTLPVIEDSAALPPKQLLPQQQPTVSRVPAQRYASGAQVGGLIILLLAFIVGLYGPLLLAFLIGTAGASMLLRSFIPKTSVRVRLACAVAGGVVLIGAVKLLPLVLGMTGSGGNIRLSNDAQVTNAGTPAAESAASESEAAPTNLDDTRRSLVGTWTYSGLESGGLWIRLVIRSDGTYEHQTADPQDDGWGKPEKGTWEAVTRKYDDTGRRWYGLDTSDDGTLILKNGTEIFDINLKLTLTKGDHFPFSK